MLARIVLAAAVALPVVFATAPAWACGGMFCSIAPVATPPAPVDQSAERIVFEVNDDDTITAHVQISYVGTADAFAWIVPVPGTPEVKESDPEMFIAVDAATTMSVVLPPPATNCGTSFGDDGGGCGGGCADDATSAAEGDLLGVDPRSPVTVYASDVTDNYEYSVIGADEAADLISWLQDNDYNVSDNMTPVMQPYIDGGMNYLAVRLRDGRDANDIQPLAMTYAGDEPMIPIQLTAVGAQPLMGIQVWIFGDAPYSPSNYAFSEPVDEEIMSDENGNTSYFAWVARTVAENDGHFFSAEYIGQNVTDWHREHQVVSRFYTRMNPEQMTLDPMFARDLDAPVASSTLDLSWQVSPFDCFGINFAALPADCAFHYCGPDATCSVVDDRVACGCPDGQVAQAITGPDGRPTATCVPPSNPFGITPQAGGVGGAFDPCASTDCGAGVCVLRNGFPTCDCDAAATACVEDDGSVICVPVPDDAATFGPGAGVESAPALSAALWDASTAAARVAAAIPLVLLAALFAIRRRD